jgi:hypothetical protein
VRRWPKSAVRTQEERVVRKFHHIGIPTETQREGETYIEGAKLFATSADECPYAIEWLRFEPDSPLPDALKTMAHVAFMVDDVDAELEGQDVLIEPCEPAPGLKVAFIMHDGAPVEFMQEC